MQDTRWGGSYPSAEKQSVYSTAPADWANEGRNRRRWQKGIGQYVEKLKNKVIKREEFIVKEVDIQRFDFHEPSSSGL